MRRDARWLDMDAKASKVETVAIVVLGALVVAFALLGVLYSLTYPTREDSHGQGTDESTAAPVRSHFE